MQFSSVGVIAGGIITRLSGITRVDAVISLLIAGAMLPRGYKLLREAGSILLDRTPSELKIAENQRTYYAGRTRNWNS